MRSKRGVFIFTIFAIAQGLGCRELQSLVASHQPDGEQQTRKVPLDDPGPGALASKHARAHADRLNHADRIVFFLGDGMGIGVATAARIYAYGEEGSLTIDDLPEAGFVRTYSRDSRVTDSAPSMSAYMTGVKMNNDVISMSAETEVNGTGHAVPTMLEWAEAAGWSTGVVTTTRVTHATPAACYAHTSNRDLENDIARQLVPNGEGSNRSLGDGLEVIFGGGTRHFVPKTEGGHRQDERNLISEMQKSGYVFASTPDELAALPTEKTKVLGLFAASHLSFDTARDVRREPSLEQMAVKAVQLPDQNPNGFFLMVEGGRIDHALHDTTAKKALDETVAFDRAIRAVINELKKTDPLLKKTLVVVTADHDHTLIHQGYAKRTGPTSDVHAGILGFVRDPVTGEPTRDLDDRPYTILSFGNGERRIDGSRATEPVLTEEVTSHDDYHQEAAIRSLPGEETHGGTDVSIHAVGFGEKKFSGFMTNTEIFDHLRHISQL